ncbi:hypothetical protein DYBT9275_01775 [Dyadobacter sp. CECT 9275]|uniref:Uncharacterized protein n=1 Tax=Dyadobacter helix TaxID=2822344 RepID=A0A916JAF2_9BACT|nr:hypothetical protein [Dyadobacter sp. CECT 9275]CAG4997440.1 hypothetical protein DYBT9275_01775 [Dyadobacter sp. CECT 9275]
MNKKLSSLVLLAVLSVTDAYLLAHPNLIGKIGIWVYKHDYIKTFPKALLTVLLVVGTSLAICELLRKFVKPRTASWIYLGMAVMGLLWFVYVYLTFSSFAYRITGKAFVYGAHLLPVVLTGLFSRYLIKSWLGSGRNQPEGV